MAWTIDAALESGCFERVVVSTDDEDIRALAERLGASAPFLRPAELARDDTPTAPVVRHVLDRLGADAARPELVAVLEPTSPARRPEHMRGVLDLLASSGADTVASVSTVPHHFVPEKVLTLDAEGTLRGASGARLRYMVHRRQDLSTYYALNGAVYACRTELVLREPPSLWGDRVLGYVMDPKYSVDLDELADWPIAEDAMRRLLAETIER